MTERFTKLDAQMEFLQIYRKYKDMSIKQANDLLSNKQEIPLSEALVLSAIMAAIKSGDPSIISKLSK